MLKQFLCALLLAPLACMAGQLVDGKDGGTQYSLNVNSAGQIPLQHQAGERNADSATGADHIASEQECAAHGPIDLSTDASTTVWNAPAVLCGYALAVTVGTAAVTIDDNATARYPIPVASLIGEHDGFGTIFETSLIVNPADGSTGSLYIYFRPLDAGVTWAY